MRISEEQHRAVKVVCYLAATVQEDSMPEEAIVRHLAVIGYLLPLLGGRKSIYDHILMPFFTAYWQHAFTKSRFCFKSPQSVEQELTKAMNLPRKRQLGFLLQAAADGLGVPLTADMRSLLTQGE